MNGRATPGQGFFRSLWFLGFLLLIACAMTGCGLSSAQIVSPGPVPTDQISMPAPPDSAPATLRVPADYPTIQQAVDAARSGQIILIEPGIYHEAVRVKTPGITIRGKDRNGVILEGDFRLPNGIEIEADNVVVENMTARHYLGNGFYWDGGKEEPGSEFHPLSGYRGSYLTAYTNGDYGIYAFNFQNGQFDHSYAAGSPDSGFYIGQCYPCNAVIDQVISEWSALGYSGTNAGGNLIIRDSIWRNNMSGIVPNTLDSEKLPPQHQTVLINNQVYDNNNTLAPAKPLEYALIGTGIGLPGGIGDVVIGNTISNQQNYGIILIGNIDDNAWVPSDNRILNNTVTNSGVADLALAAPSGAGNCFSGNTASRTLPVLIEQKYPCDTPLPLLEGGDPSLSPVVLSRFLYARGGNFHPRDWRTVDLQEIPDAANQPTMPADLLAGLARPIFPDLSLFDLPADAQTPGVASSTLTPLLSGGSSMFQFLLGLYAELLPIALYAAWLSLGFWDLARNEKLSNAAKLLWMVVLVVIPILGPIAYYLFGRSQLSRSFRVMFVIGAPVLYLAVTGLLVWIASL